MSLCFARAHLLRTTGKTKRIDIIICSLVRNRKLHSTRKGTTSTSSRRGLCSASSPSRGRRRKWRSALRTSKGRASGSWPSCTTTHGRRREKNNKKTNRNQREAAGRLHTGYRPFTDRLHTPDVRREVVTTAKILQREGLKVVKSSALNTRTRASRSSNLQSWPAVASTRAMFSCFRVFRSGLLPVVGRR